MGVSGSTDDDYISTLINATSDVIRRFCDRTFFYEADIEESVPGYGNTRLMLSRTPIVGVIDSITYNDSTLDEDSYSVENAEAGFVYRQYGFIWTAQTNSGILYDQIPGTEKSSYVVTYTGGYQTPQQVVDDTTPARSLPYDLEDACLQLVTSRYRARGRDPRISAERLLSWQATYGMATTDRSHAIPRAIQGMLAPYKRFS